MIIYGQIMKFISMQKIAPFLFLQ